MIATVPVSLEIESDQVKPLSQQRGSVNVKIRTIYEKRNEKESAYGWLISVFWMVVPIAMLFIGLFYMEKCSGRHLIPVYLVVGGAVSLVEAIRQVCRRLDVFGEKQDYLGVVLQLFLFVWLITGSVWVYGVNGTYKTKMTHNSADTTGNYCHQVPFVFALVQITTVWCLLVLAMVIHCAVYCPCRGWQIF